MPWQDAYYLRRKLRRLFYISIPMIATKYYNNASASVLINVAKGNETISWSNPAPTVYGTPLNATQLNAIVSVSGPAPAGALISDPPGATVSGAGTGQPLTVRAAATPNHPGPR